MECMFHRETRIYSAHNYGTHLMPMEMLTECMDGHSFSCGLLLTIASEASYLLSFSCCCYYYYYFIFLEIVQ